MDLVAALILFALLVLAAAVATAVTLVGDGHPRRAAPQEEPAAPGGLPWGPYRDAWPVTRPRG